MLAFLGVAVVVVRVYDVTGMADVDRRDAFDVAHNALAAANVHVVFRDCGSSGSKSKDEACDTPPEQGERIVRIMNAPANLPMGMGTSLGFALVDSGTNRGVLATIYADRVARVSAGQIDRVLLFGRVVAHELGHLLLGVTAHSNAGLMRAFWTDQQVRRNESSDWAFSAEDRQRICLSLLGKRSLCGSRVGSGHPPAGESTGRATFATNDRQLTSRVNGTSAPSRRAPPPPVPIAWIGEE
jgi:hypothetical protein